MERRTFLTVSAILMGGAAAEGLFLWGIKAISTSTSGGIPPAENPQRFQQDILTQFAGTPETGVQLTGDTIQQRPDAYTSAGTWAPGFAILSLQGQITRLYVVTDQEYQGTDHQNKVAFVTDSNGVPINRYGEVGLGFRDRPLSEIINAAGAFTEQNGNLTVLSVPLEATQEQIKKLQRGDLKIYIATREDTKIKPLAIYSIPPVSAK